MYLHQIGGGWVKGLRICVIINSAVRPPQIITSLDKRWSKTTTSQTRGGNTKEQSCIEENIVFHGCFLVKMCSIFSRLLIAAKCLRFLCSLSMIHGSVSQPWCQLIQIVIIHQWDKQKPDFSLSVCLYADPLPVCVCACQCMSLNIRLTCVVYLIF